MKFIKLLLTSVVVGVLSAPAFMHAGKGALRQKGEGALEFRNRMQQEMAQQRAAIQKQEAAENKPLSDQEWEQVVKKFRPLFIVLDDLEELFAFAGKVLFKALSEQAGPIVVSASLVADLFSVEPYKSKPGEDAEAIFDLLDKTTDRAIALSLYKLFAPFNENDWIIKLVNPQLVLFIPKAYLERMGVKFSAVEMVVQAGAPATEIELQLGLKVNHMQKGVLASIKKPSPTPIWPDYFIEALYDGKQPTTDDERMQAQSSALFCANADYKLAYKENAIPVWSIFIAGHGSRGSRVVGMSFEQFNSFLYFLAYRLDVRLLAYVSCYSAGLNALLMYADSRNALGIATYPFAIITKATTDAPTIAQTTARLRGGKLLIDAHVYQDFISNVSQPLIQYQKVVKDLGDNFGEEGLTAANIAQIKLPGTEWFSPTNDIVVSIGEILANNRDPQKALDVIPYFKKDPKAILLYAKDIPFELLINSVDKDKSIVSMVPGNAVHTLKRINAPKIPVTDIVDWFMKIPDLAVEKVFRIEEVQGSDGILNNVIIGNVDGEKFKALYSKNNDATKIFKQEGAAASALVTDPKILIQYKKLIVQGSTNLDELLYKTVQVGPFVVTLDPDDLKKPAVWTPEIPDLSAITVISKITGQTTKSSNYSATPSIESIVRDVYHQRLSQKRDKLIIMNEITGDYFTWSGTKIEIPGLENFEIFTVKDVFLIPGDFSFYFTYVDKQGKTHFYNNKNELTKDYKPELIKKYQQQLTGALIPHQADVGDFKKRQQELALDAVQQQQLSEKLKALKKRPMPPLPPLPRVEPVPAEAPVMQSSKSKAMPTRPIPPVPPVDVKPPVTPVPSEPAQEVKEPKVTPGVQPDVTAEPTPVPPAKPQITKLPPSLAVKKEPTPEPIPVVKEKPTSVPVIPQPTVKPFAVPPTAPVPVVKPQMTSPSMPAVKKESIPAPAPAAPKYVDPVMQRLHKEGLILNSQSFKTARRLVNLNLVKVISHNAANMGGAALNADHALKNGNALLMLALGRKININQELNDPAFARAWLDKLKAEGNWLDSAKLVDSLKKFGYTIDDVGKMTILQNVAKQRADVEKINAQDRFPSVFIMPPTEADGAKDWIAVLVTKENEITNYYVANSDNSFALPAARASAIGTLVNIIDGQ